MKIHDFFGQYACNSEEELLHILRTKTRNGRNDFELRHEGSYPYLAILVNVNKACAHYFLNENDCGHYAYVEENGLTIDGFTTFYIGSEESETQVSNRMVIPVEHACIAAKAFFHESIMVPDLLWYSL